MDDYLFSEEIIFPEEGGVTGQRSVNGHRKDSYTFDNMCNMSPSWMT